MVQFYTTASATFSSIHIFNTMSYSAPSSSMPGQTSYNIQSIRVTSEVHHRDLITSLVLFPNHIVSWKAIHRRYSLETRASFSVSSAPLNE
jgi:hypothetical protein